MPIFYHILQNNNFWLPRYLKIPLRRSRGHLTYKSHDMMCSNEFLYQWDQFCCTFHHISIVATDSDLLEFAPKSEFWLIWSNFTPILSQNSNIFWQTFYLLNSEFCPLNSNFCQICYDFTQIFAFFFSIFFIF